MFPHNPSCNGHLDVNWRFFPNEAASEPFPFNMFGLMFTLIPAVMILAGWAFAISLGVSGNYLAKKKNYTFVLVMAGISCMCNRSGDSHFFQR